MHTVQLSIKGLAGEIFFFGGGGLKVQSHQIIYFLLGSINYNPLAGETVPLSDIIEKVRFT